MHRRSFLKASGLALAGSPFWLGFLPERLWGKVPQKVRITGLKTMIVEDEVYLKIFTDQGVVGEGHAAVHRKAATCQAAVEDLARVLVGQDATRIEFLWQAMYRWPRWRGGPVLNAAISRHLVSYVQPDVIQCGGITEIKKIAAMAEAQFIDVAPHCPGSLSTGLGLASLHVNASTPNCVIQESRPNPTGWQLEMSIEHSRPVNRRAFPGRAAGGAAAAIEVRYWSNASRSFAADASGAATHSEHGHIELA